MAAPHVLKWDTYHNLATLMIEKPRELPELKNPFFTFCLQLSGTGVYLYSPTELLKHDQVLLMDEQLP